MTLSAQAPSPPDDGKPSWRQRLVVVMLSLVWLYEFGRVWMWQFRHPIAWPLPLGEGWALATGVAVVLAMAFLHRRSLSVRSLWVGYVGSVGFFASSLFARADPPSLVMSLWGACVGLLLGVPIHAFASARWSRPSKFDKALLVAAIGLFLACYGAAVGSSRISSDTLLIGVGILSVVWIALSDDSGARAALAACYLTAFFVSFEGSSWEIAAQERLGAGRLEAIRAGMWELQSGLFERMWPLLVVQVYTVLRTRPSRRSLPYVGPALLLLLGWIVLMLRAGTVAKNLAWAVAPF